MIIVIKGRNKKQLIIKALSMLSLIIMFALYYNHMGNKFSSMGNEIVNNNNLNIQQKVLDKSMKLERTIYKEAVIMVNLLEQKNVQSVKVIKDKLLIVCDYGTNIEPLLVRYGVNAMIKSTSKNIKIAVDLKIIVENKYES
jgi:hypothetical protein